MSTQTTQKEQFIESFDAQPFGNESNQFDGPDEAAYASNDETVMWIGDQYQSWGSLSFSQYHENEGWSLATAEWDGGDESVYVFESRWSTKPIQVVISATKIEQVADCLEQSPSEVADSVRVHNEYPVVIPTENGRVAIAPILNADIDT